MTIAISALEHELGIAGHEDGCPDCARDEVRRKLEHTLAVGRRHRLLSLSEQREMVFAMRDPKILDELAKRWGMTPP